MTDRRLSPTASAEAAIVASGAEVRLKIAPPTPDAMSIEPLLTLYFRDERA